MSRLTPRRKGLRGDMDAFGEESLIPYINHGDGREKPSRTRQSNPAEFASASSDLRVLSRLLFRRPPLIWWETTMLGYLAHVSCATKTRLSCSIEGVSALESLSLFPSWRHYTYSQAVIHQPGLHLHPRLQSVLGDLLVEDIWQHFRMPLSESHSEHLLLRVLSAYARVSSAGVSRRRFLRGRRRRSLYFDEQDDEVAPSITTQINSEGEFIDRWATRLTERRRCPPFLKRSRLSRPRLSPRDLRDVHIVFKAFAQGPDGAQQNRVEHEL